MTFSTSAEFLSELASSLRAELPESSLDQVQVRDGLPALLVMEVGHLVAAFAIGHDESTYDVFYPAFKKHFASKGAAWNAKDVSFVYCLPEAQRPTDKFCSQVEVDVYFCRKFVVLLGQDVGASLLRLPFFPLSPVTGPQLRQPPAATFLQTAGAKAELATNLVKPGRSATTILTNCLAGRFGEPVLHFQKSDKGTATVTAEVARAQSALKTLCIENFRAYRMKQVFEFGSAVTVLYGPNGFGKTSFFDALDFAATGGVARFARSGTAFDRAVRHLDSSEHDKTVVTLTFDRDGTTHTLSRDLNDVNKAVLDGNPGIDRKEILNLLTGSESSPSDRVDHLVALFRATHLFGQENQALTENFSGTCEVSAELVSRMLAFEDYVSAVNKASAVHQAAKDAVASADNVAGALRAKFKIDEAELARLTGAASTVDTKGIESSLHELQVGAEGLGFDIDVEATVDSLRGLRFALEERFGTLEVRRSRLTECLEAVAARGACLNELMELRIEVENLSGIVAKASEENQKHLADRQAAIAKVASTNQDVAASQRRFNAIEWALQTKPEFEERNQHEKGTRVQLKLAQQAKSQALAEVDALAATEAAAVSLHQQAIGAAEKSAEALESIQKLRRGASELHDVYARQLRVAAQIASCNDTAVQLQHRAQTLQKAVLEEGGRVAQLDLLVVQAKQRDSELRTLVSQLRQHVTDGVCVFCAHDHGSLEALLRRIDTQTPQSAALSELLARLSTYRDQKAVVDAELLEVEAKLQAAKSELSDATRERDRLDAVISSLMQSLGAAGVQAPRDASPQEVEGAVEGTLTAAEAHRRLLVDQVRECHERLNLAKSEHAAARARKDDAEAVVGRAEGALSAVRQILDAISNDARARQVDLDLAVDKLTLLLASERQSLEAAKSSAQLARLTADEAASAEKEAEARVSVAASALRQANGRISNGETRLNSIDRTLVGAGQPVSASDSSVRDAVSLVTSEASRVVTCKEKAEVLEMAIDAAATAASLQGIKSRLAEGASAIAAAEEEAKLNKPWALYFGRLATALEEEQSKATQYFTEQYGPRTAVIQRRLRPVYGFEDIEVSTQGSSIAVRVKRGGESHKPTDYFSQSQVQTLLLGLFLTACSSQTWSGLSAILMDDPVTHFDDLNTYALLDLLSGLLHSPEGNRQFVISTCDEKLLQLARQKFRHLGVEARFYRFSALGAEGPLISEIPN